MKTIGRATPIMYKKWSIYNGFFKSKGNIQWNLSNMDTKIIVQIIEVFVGDSSSVLINRVSLFQRYPLGDVPLYHYIWYLITNDNFFTVNYVKQYEMLNHNTVSYFIPLRIFVVSTA